MTSYYGDTMMMISSSLWCLLFYLKSHAYIACQGSVSLQPVMNIVLSLPPWLRYKADNILVSMLIPSELSATAQKKYFDKVVANDYNPMFEDGLINSFDETIRVQIFAQVLDLKGKEKFFNQVSVQSYVGCSHCVAHFDKG